MNSNTFTRLFPRVSRSGFLRLLLPALLPVVVEAAPNVLLWDTGTPFSAQVNVADRSSWKPVPSDLLTLEADPAKARSDPGYYGREYLFKGDAVVENPQLLAVFWSAKGKVVLYSKTAGMNPGGSGGADSVSPGKLCELDLSGGKSGFTPPEILRNGDDEVTLKVGWQAGENASAVLDFGRSEIVEVKPSAAVSTLNVLAEFDYAVVPSFIGDDLIFDAQTPGAGHTLYLPAENFLVGLLRGEGSELVMTWPKGEQQARVELAEEQGRERRIQSIEFSTGGESIFLAPLVSPGIWHKQTLSPSYLEKDVAIDWKRPFPAKWKTQLFEQDLKTTFSFRQTRGDIWRGVPGSYNYPVWFEGDQAFYHLSKKVPPKGESLIYFLEAHETPLSVTTPSDVLKATLGRPMADDILDVAGRKLRTHHRRGAAGVHRACTCGCTEAIQAIFEAGDEVSQKQEVQGDLEDMMYFVHHHVDRINEYRRFAEELTKFLQSAKTSSPECGPYLDRLAEVISQIPQECSVQQENMKSFAYADDLVRRTMLLTEKHDTNNLPAYLDLLKEWRGMGGAQDYVLAQCHIIARRLDQEAGYGVVNLPKAVVLAQQIRAKARQILSHPDGYEIWADY